MQSKQTWNKLRFVLRTTYYLRHVHTHMCHLGIYCGRRMTIFIHIILNANVVHMNEFSRKKRILGLFHSFFPSFSLPSYFFSLTYNFTFFDHSLICFLRTSIQLILQTNMILMFSFPTFACCSHSDEICSVLHRRTYQHMMLVILCCVAFQECLLILLWLQGTLAVLCTVLLFRFTTNRERKEQAGKRREQRKRTRKLSASFFFFLHECSSEFGVKRSHRVRSSHPIFVVVSHRLMCFLQFGTVVVQIFFFSHSVLLVFLLFSYFQLNVDLIYFCSRNLLFFFVKSLNRVKNVES